MKRDHARQVTRDRAVLGVVGVILAALAVLAALLHWGVIDRLGSLRHDGLVVNGSVREHLVRNELPWQLITLGVGLLLIALGVWWLWGQIPPLPSQQDAEIDVPSEVAGTTTVAGGALARALEDDLSRDPEVAGAKAEVRTDDQLVRLRVDVPRRADLDRVLDHVVPQALHRYATVAGLPAVPETEIEVRLVDVAERTVR